MAELMLMDGVSRFESVTQLGSLWNAALGAESGVVRVVSQSVPSVQVPVGVHAFTPLVKLLIHPAGNAGAVTPSKFSLKTVVCPGHIGVGDGVGDGVGVGVGLGVGVGVTAPEQTIFMLSILQPTRDALLSEPMRQRKIQSWFIAEAGRLTMTVCQSLCWVAVVALLQHCRPASGLLKTVETVLL
jgi:hypothetical protein